MQPTKVFTCWIDRSETLRRRWGWRTTSSRNSRRPKQQKNLWMYCCGWASQ